jgi:hypothetical protein
MSLTGFKKVNVTSGVPIWQTPVETAQGGFSLVTTGHTIDDVIAAGAVVGFDESTRLATVVKSATLHANATDSDENYDVEKGHGLIVGDYIAAVVGGKAYAITAIDTSDPDFDTLTVGTTLAVALTAPTAIFQSVATGATAGAYFVTPKGLLYEDVTVAVGASISVVLRGTVYARRIPAYDEGIPALMPNIIFSQSL